MDAAAGTHVLVRLEEDSEIQHGAGRMGLPPILSISGGIKGLAMVQSP